jgi:hypothetical protein
MRADDETEESSRDERRQHDRARLIVDVHFAGGDATGVASTRDISAGGLYMSTQAEIGIGEILTLRIPIGGQHVVVDAEVVYSHPGHGVGVQFRNLPAEAKQVLEKELPSS